MAELSRRGLFGFLAGGVAASAFSKGLAATVLEEAPVVAAPLALDGFSAELIGITHRAFVPRLVLQVYKRHPLLSLAMRSRDDAVR